MSDNSRVVGRVALVLVGVVPVAGAALCAIERLRRNQYRTPTRLGRENMLVGLLGLLLLAIPQLILDGFSGEVLWVATSAASLVLAIVLVSFTSSGVSIRGPGEFTLGASAAVLGAPALWGLVSASEVSLWWVNHTNVWAAMAVMVAAATVALYRRKLWVHALFWLYLSSVLVVSFVGSRTALFAVAAGLVATTVVHLPGSGRIRRVALFGVIGLTIAAVVVVVSPLRTRLAGLIPAQTTNLVLASEEVGGEYWSLRGAEVLTERGDGAFNWFRILSTSGKALDRVHQRFVLPAGAVHTLVFEYRQRGTQGGLVAFSEPTGSMIVPFDAPDALQVTGNLEVLNATQVQGDDNWTRFELTVENVGEGPLIWHLGFATSLRDADPSELNLRHVRLVRGAGDVEYSPTYSADRVRSLASLSAGQRLGYVKGAVSLLRERPLFGHGSAKPFYALLDELELSTSAASTDRPWHAHSLVGDVLVRFGSVGLLGLVLLITGAVRTLPPGKRLVALPFLVVVFVLGLGDATFFDAGGPFVLSLVLLTIGTGADA